jgi:hypothetical protein
MGLTALRRTPYQLPLTIGLLEELTVSNDANPEQIYYEDFLVAPVRIQ